MVSSIFVGCHFFFMGFMEIEVAGLVNRFIDYPYLFVIVGFIYFWVGIIRVCILF